MLIHNCHTHTFSSNSVPENLLPCGLVRFLARRRFLRRFARFLNRLNPLSSDDIFDRFATFLRIGSRPQKAIFKDLQNVYPAGTKFVVLSIDQAYRGAGNVPQPFEKQLEELEELKQIHGDVLLPFVFVDPRRNDVMSLALDCLENRGFAGIKLYSQYGYFPYDERLTELLKYAETHQIPIIPHAAAAFGDYRGSKAELWNLLNQCKLENIDLKAVIETLTKDYRRWGTIRQKICSFFGHPVQYLYLLNQYPNLKISFAHMGGNQDWSYYPPSKEEIEKYGNIVGEIKALLKTQENPQLLKEKLEAAFNLNWLFLIEQMMREYNNVYADISFTLSNPQFFPTLNNLLADNTLRSKILFGTDYYMVEVDTSEENFYSALRQGIGEENFRQIAETNPQVFLESRSRILA